MVYLTTYKPTNIKYAIKMIDIKNKDRSNNRVQVEKEIMIQKKLDHPYILKIHSIL